MSGNNSYPKSYKANGYPIHVSEPNAALKRVEALLTPKLFRSRFLKGIQEILLDKLGIKYSNEELKDFINRAINTIELELNMSVVAQEYSEKIAWDQSLWNNWIFTQTTHPILRLKDFSIRSANGDNLFRLPAEWVDAGQFHARQINIVPLLSVQSSGGVVASSPTGLGFSLLYRAGVQWIPSYYEVVYDSGICLDGSSVPVVVNELIGVVAAMDLLSSVASLNMYNSVSLSQDGLGQSSSSSGPQIFALRMQELQAKRDSIMKQLKRVFSQRFFMSNI